MARLDVSRWREALAALAMAALSCAHAQSDSGPRQVDAPAELARWRGWIEQTNPSRRCADGAEQGCLWLGALELAESAPGRWIGKFEALNLSGDSAKARLPADDGKWPSRATVDGKPATIGRDEQGAYVTIEPRGKHALAYEFDLSRAVSSQLQAPSAFGMVSVRPIGRPIRQADPSQPVELAAKPAEGKAPLAERPALAPGKPTASVSRLLADSQVPTLTTRVKIDNGGTRKVINLDGLLPVGSLPVQLQGAGSKLSGASLQVEAAPGTTIVTITSRLDPSLKVDWGRPTSVDADVAPRQYVFVRSNESFRKVSAQGSAIDPKSIDPALSFGDLPAYEVGERSALALAPKAIEAVGEEISARARTTLWLDFTGSELFASQHLVFSKSAPGWFEPAAGWRATQASSGGSPLIVSKSEAGSAGRVALRNGMSEMTVGLSAPAGSWLAIPAVGSPGISAPQADATLRLPPGWRALGVFGAGHSDVGWFAAMSLWDWFLLIVAAWLAKSLLGWRAAGALLAGMALGRLFLGAPFVLFVPLLLLSALHKHLPAGKLRRVALICVMGLGALVIAQLAPYTMERVQKTLHGGLEDRAQPGSGYTLSAYDRGQARDPSKSPGAAEAEGSDAQIGAVAGNAMPAPAAPAAAPVPMEARSDMEGSSLPRKALAESVAASKDALRGAGSLTRDAPAPRELPSVSGAQAGQGVPAWEAGISVPISFSGPASSESVARVLLMPSWLVKIASLGSLAALWAALGLIVAFAWRHREPPAPDADAAQPSSQGVSA